MCHHRSDRRSTVLLLYVPLWRCAAWSHAPGSAKCRRRSRRPADLGADPCSLSHTHDTSRHRSVQLQPRGAAALACRPKRPRGSRGVIMMSERCAGTVKAGPAGWRQNGGKLCHGQDAACLRVYRLPCLFTLLPPRVQTGQLPLPLLLESRAQAQRRLLAINHGKIKFSCAIKWHNKITV